MWVFPIIRCCVCVKNMNAEDTNPTRVSEAKHYCIPTEVITNLALLNIGIPPSDSYPATPTSSGRRLPFYHYAIYFGFFCHFIWVLGSPAYICPLLVQETIPDTYKPPPPPPLATARVLHRNRIATYISCQGDIMERYTKVPMQGVCVCVCVCVCVRGCVCNKSLLVFLLFMSRHLLRSKLPS